MAVIRSVVHEEIADNSDLSRGPSVRGCTCRRRLCRAAGRLAAKKRGSAARGRKGWVVRRIKIDDGCYEIKGTDREGRRIEVTVDPGTLQVIEIEYKDGDDRRSREGREHKHD